MLHICPKDAGSVYFHFHFGRHEAKRLFGLLSGIEEQIHYVEDYPFRRVPDLIRMFSIGGTDGIIAIPGETSTLQL